MIPETRQLWAEFLNLPNIRPTFLVNIRNPPELEEFYQSQHKHYSISWE